MVCLSLCCRPARSSVSSSKRSTLTGSPRIDASAATAKGQACWLECSSLLLTVATALSTSMPSLWQAVACI